MDEQTADRIRDLYERKTRAMAAKPSFARGSGTSTARLGDGFACAVVSGRHQIAVDFDEGEGGAGTGPGPGQVMRSGLAACLAIGYRLWAIRLGVALDEVTVQVTCELDVRGQLGVDGVPVGWQKVSWIVRVVSGAAEEDVRRALDEADRASPMLASLDRDIARHRAVEITRRPS